MTNDVLETLALADLADYLKPRLPDAHKGLFGHVLVVGGDYGFAGAVRMAAEAALRAGAGLVSVATRPEHGFAISAARPEIMCHGIRTSQELLPLLEKATVIVGGPGLGQSAWSKEMFAELIKVKKNRVLDADALNLLAAVPQSAADWILTPHPGEAARLLQTRTEDIQADRTTAIKKLQKAFGGVCVLKGAGTLIAGAEGDPVKCDAGNPGMATAGMGDILSGIIGGLAAQHIPLLAAAKLGVLLHAQAGDLAANYGARGMIATDLLPFLRRLVNP